MRSPLVLLFLAALLGASCAAQPALTLDAAPLPLETSAPDSPPMESASSQTPARSEIRFALVGAPRDVNVWALFDEAGASYADYAPRFDYYPRLYHLAPPDFSFQPLAAQSLPSGVSETGGVYSAVVHLRPDLKWSDGSPFTAEDLAFTVQTALAFELGYDWRAAYSPDVLERVEVLDPYAAKFVFKKKPDVGEWQYGALLGRVVQKNFWRGRIAAAEALLPSAEQSAEVEKARAKLAEVQFVVNDLTARLQALRETGGSSRDLEIQLAQRKLELGYAKNNLNKAREAYQSALRTARQSLYEADGAGEPTLGAWTFESKTDKAWVNRANPAFPFGKPRFERAAYLFFPSEKEALAALEQGKADFVLAPQGLSRSVQGASLQPTYSARFLVFHPTKPQFADPALRSALSCMIDRDELARDVLKGNAFPLEGYIVSAQFRAPNLSAPCAGMNAAQRQEYAADLLKRAGYSWKSRRLHTPQGEAFPESALLAPSQKEDPLRYAAAQYVAGRAQQLGIPLRAQEAGANGIRYAVYSSRQFDAALLGWRLSEYPQYLCDWFGGNDPYLYAGDSFRADCDALAAEADLESARKILQRLEANLAREQVFIPLFLAARVEAYRRLAYPSVSLPNGWGGLYGAPSYAMPAP